MIKAKAVALANVNAKNNCKCYGKSLSKTQTMVKRRDVGLFSFFIKGFCRGAEGQGAEG
jgi:hypothetical protein